ncbi:ABC transporter ATP-binding protein [bacterium]
MSDLFSINALEFVYPINKNKKVLSNINISISQGQSLVIHGSAGSGKTTLINLILGLLKPSKGRLMFKDKDCYGNTGILLNETGYVSQSPIDQFIGRTVYEDIVFSVRNEAESKNDKLFSIINKLDIKLNILNRPPHTLSTGEALLCTAAGALINDPAVLILDDPLQGLDDNHKTKIMEIINIYIKDKKKTLIITTTNEELIDGTKCYRLGKIE